MNLSNLVTSPALDRCSLLQVVQLHNRHLLLPERYPRFTLLGQALGSVRLGYEALTNAVPEVCAVKANTSSQCANPQCLHVMLLHPTRIDACKSLHPHHKPRAS